MRVIQPGHLFVPQQLFAATMGRYWTTHRVCVVVGISPTHPFSINSTILSSSNNATHSLTSSRQKKKRQKKNFVVNTSTNYNCVTLDRRVWLTVEHIKTVVLWTSVVLSLPRQSWKPNWAFLLEGFIVRFSLSQIHLREFCNISLNFIWIYWMYHY